MSGADDQDIWGLYAKGVKRMGQQEEPPQQKQKTKKAAPLQTKSAVPLPWAVQEDKKAPLPPAPPTTPLPPSLPPLPKTWKKEPLDLRVERNLSLGDVFIEAKLDLHGRSEQEAYEVFQAFIEKQSDRGKRMLLVITGKGGMEGSSILRANLPRWCNVPPFDASVMAVRTAAQHHGGDGAYYVLLRKRGTP